MGKSGREVPKSQCMRVYAREMIEASSNMVRWSASVSVSLRLRVPLPPFIDSRRDGLHAREISGVVLFFPNRGRTVDGPCCRALWGMAPGVVVVLGSPLTVSGMCPYPVAPVDGVAIAVEARCAPCSTRRGAGAPRVLPIAASSWSIAMICSRVIAHARRGSCRGGSAKIW